MVVVRFELTRAARTETRSVEVAAGSLLRRALRQAGLAAEGSAVLLGEDPVPLDIPITEATCFTVISTFSGG